MSAKKKHNNNSKTSIYKIKTNNSNKKRHHKLKVIISILVILIILSILAVAGIFAGIFFSDKWLITKEDLIANENTEVFDIEQNKIATLSAQDGTENRKIISLDQMGKYTPDAYISIEDKRFYEHTGVDILRTAKATISYISNKGSNSNVGGGSTITQQLVKNLMKDKAKTGKEGIERKIREMSRAYQIEKMLSKKQILEKYLNVIFIGGNELYGIEYGARYYFAKSAKDLNLAESAFLAGINHAPNIYNPYDSQHDNSDLIKDRTKLVLNFMKEQNRISNDPEESKKLYDEAIEEVEKGFEFKKGDFEIGNMTYFVAAATKQVAKDLARTKDIDYKEAESMVRTGGYKLYTTQDTKIQNIILEELAKKQYGETKTVTKRKKDGTKEKITDKTQVGMVIIDFKTGKIVGIGGALNSDQGTNTNYAIDIRRQTGSSIKPLGNIAPGLEEKIITAATIYDDSRTDFRLPYMPKNAGGYYEGLISVRRAIVISSNMVNMKIFSNIGANTVINYLNKFGLDTYNKEEDGMITLSIGGAHNGSSPLQMAAGYGALANGGVYIEPTFYEKLVDRNGKIVVKPTQKSRRVISEANAFIISDILTGVTTQRGGTALPCAIRGMDVAAKTGTTDNYTNKWLCGYTPYYAAATWYGFEHYEWGVNKINTARTIWANVMKKVHSDLKGKKFEKPDDVVSAKICKNSGKLATSKCSNTYTEYFAKGTVPKACDGHVRLKICKESGKIATQYCTDVEEKIYAMKPEKEENGWWKVSSGNKYNKPTEICDIHTEETNKITVVNVVGKTQTEAIQLLKGMNIKIIEGHDVTKPNGVVLNQTLAGGIKVDKGVNITITVNKISTTLPNVPSYQNTNEPINDIKNRQKSHSNHVNN